MQPLLVHSSELGSFCTTFQDLMMHLKNAIFPATCTGPEVAVAISFLDDNKEMNRFTVALFAWSSGAAMIKTAREMVNTNVSDKSNKERLLQQIPLVEAACEGHVGIAPSVCISSIKIWMNRLSGPCTSIVDILKTSSAGFRAQLKEEGVLARIGDAYVKCFDGWLSVFEHSFTELDTRFLANLTAISDDGNVAPEDCQLLIKTFEKDAIAASWMEASFAQLDLMCCAVEKDVTSKHMDLCQKSTLYNHVGQAGEMFARTRAVPANCDGWMDMFCKATKAIAHVARQRLSLTADVAAEAEVLALLALWDATLFCLLRR